jgi:hypothetical protein
LILAGKMALVLALAELAILTLILSSNVSIVNAQEGRIHIFARDGNGDPVSFGGITTLLITMLKMAIIHFEWRQ